jgi:hypothetical protein
MEKFLRKIWCTLSTELEEKVKGNRYPWQLDNFVIINLNLI